MFDTSLEADNDDTCLARTIFVPYKSEDLTTKDYTSPLFEGLASIGIMGDQLRTPLKPLNMIVL